MNADPEIVPVTADHRDGWRRLFADYCAAGGIEALPPHLDKVERPTPLRPGRG